MVEANEVSHGMVEANEVSHGMVEANEVSHGMVEANVVSHGMVEANVVSHGMAFMEKWLGCDPSWHDAIVERNVRQVLNYRANACNVM